MGYKSFDQYASEYDACFIKNENVLECELRLVAACLEKGKDILSMGCGSGLFEKLLKDNHDIDVRKGIEPAGAKVDIARKRGMNVIVGTAEEVDHGKECFSHLVVEDPQEGYDRGAYVAICDTRK